MVRSRIYGILADYQDQNDHDTLRHDPVFKLLADRSPNDDDLASQPTLSRFENAITIKSLKNVRDVFIDQFIASFDQAPHHLTIDLDAVVDPAHGHQQLTFWHGYYDQNQYLPLVVTCADNDQFVMVALRPGNVHAAVGADDDLAYLVKRLRQVWPDALLQIRGDCGFGVPRRYDISESLDINCTFGLSSNAVLQRLTEDLLATAVATYERRRQEARQHEPPRPAEPVRLFRGFWYAADSWPHARYVVAKVEANAQAMNQRSLWPGFVGCPTVCSGHFLTIAKINPVLPGLQWVKNGHSRALSSPVFPENQAILGGTSLVLRNESRWRSSCAPDYETQRRFFYRLDLGIEPLTDGVGDLMIAVVQDATQVVLQRAATKITGLSRECVAQKCHFFQNRLAHPLR